MKVSLSHAEILQAVSDFMIKRNLRIPDVTDQEKFAVAYSEEVNEISIEIRDVEVAPVATPSPPARPRAAMRDLPSEPEEEEEDDPAATAQSIRALAAQNAQSLARRPPPTKPDGSSLNRFQRVEMSRSLDDLIGKETSDMSDEIG